jgi:hypothetical protein
MFADRKWLLVAGGLLLAMIAVAVLIPAGWHRLGLH